MSYSKEQQNELRKCVCKEVMVKETEEYEEVIFKNQVFIKGILQLSISVLVVCIQSKSLQQVLQFAQWSFILCTCVFSSTLEQPWEQQKQNSIVQVGEGLIRSLDQPYDQVAQGFVHQGLESLHERRVYNLHEQPVPVLDCCHSKVFPLKYEPPHVAVVSSCCHAPQLIVVFHFLGNLSYWKEVLGFCVRSSD